MPWPLTSPSRSGRGWPAGARMPSRRSSSRTLAILNSAGTSYMVPLSALSSAGTSYTITSAVLDSSNTSFTVI